MSKLLVLALVSGLVVGYQPIKQSLQDAINIKHVYYVDGILLSATVLVLAVTFLAELSVIWTFAFNCFIRPLGKSKNQASRLNKFYEKQAEVYDKTRTKLLRGRRTMLQLSSSYLIEKRRQNLEKRLVWLDIGGGTGWNVEQMDQYMPISDFDAVYVLDLCEPLLAKAKKRFEARGWKNVHCLLQDATTFVLPEWETEGVDPDGALDFVTMSYSLSMMPDFYTLLDRVDQFLIPGGLLSVCDFYVSSRESQSFVEILGDTASRHCSWLTRLFWQAWFELDHVDLHPSRRHYLEHVFGTIKSFNGRNNFIIPGLIKIPYYVALCTSKRTNTARAHQAYEIDAGSTVSARSSPFIVPLKSPKVESGLLTPISDVPDLNIGPSMLKKNSRQRTTSLLSTHSDFTRIDIAPQGALSAFHYGIKNWRVPYLVTPVQNEFRTWIYGFTWEDPAVDIEYLSLTKEDTVFCITSAGDNALHYAIEAQPKRIHAVDMNPSQGHLLELKLAAIASLSYDEFWSLFGDGKNPSFRTLLDIKISPFLTSHAYQFWRVNANSFDSSFYLRGYSGWALRLAKYAFWVAGATKDVNDFCAADSLKLQTEIWNKRLRPHLLKGWVVKLFLSNPAFLWNALGVPINQMKIFLKETSPRAYAEDTLDPVANRTHIKTGAYHYQICLQHKYTKASCPLYLTEKGFNFLKQNNGQEMDRFRLHTDTVQSVLKQLGPNSITVAVLMDLQDWFDNTIDTPSGKQCDLTLLIRDLHCALKPGGRVFWRSAGIKPWYAELYKSEGFRVECIHSRTIGSLEPIDRVNMYASFYKAVKV